VALTGLLAGAVGVAAPQLAVSSPRSRSWSCRSPSVARKIPRRVSARWMS
jgi:hypothetical protein